MGVFGIVAAAIIAGTGAWYITRLSFTERIKTLERMHAKELENADKLLNQAQENYENALHPSW